MASKSSKIILTDSQKSYLSLNWDKEGKDLNTLAKECSGDPSIDGHSAFALAVKTFLVTLVGEETVKAKLKTSKFIKGEELVLTKDQEEMVRKNYTSMKVIEIVNILFNTGEIKKKFGPLHKEYRVVYSFVNSLDPMCIPKDEQIAEEGEYNPPQSMVRLVPRVNKYYINKKDPLKKFLDPENITHQQGRLLNSLMSYMHNYRFCYQMSQYRNKVDRELFEATFVEFLYAKPDETEENVHSYIDLCTEIVNISSSERTIQLLKQKHYDILSGQDDGKLSHTLAETLDTMTERQNDSKKRSDSLKKDLVGKRVEKEGEKNASNATFLNLVEAVQQEKTRKELLAIAEKQRELEVIEVDKLSDMDSVVALIAGMNKERAKYG